MVVLVLCVCVCVRVIHSKLRFTSAFACGLESWPAWPAWMIGSIFDFEICLEVLYSRNTLLCELANQLTRYCGAGLYVVQVQYNTMNINKHVQCTMYVMVQCYTMEINKVNCKKTAGQCWREIQFPISLPLEIQPLALLLDQEWLFQLFAVNLHLIRSKMLLLSNVWTTVSYFWNQS